MNHRCPFLAGLMACMFVLTAPIARPADAVSPLDSSAQIRVAIRSAVARFAQQAAARQQDDGGLSKRVEEFLAQPRVGEPSPSTDPKEALLDLLVTPKISVSQQPSFDSSVGFTFDGSPEGTEMELRELREKLAHTPDDLPLAYRAYSLASEGTDKTLTTQLHDQAVALARRQLSMNPSSAEAHAWLAQALGWNKGTHKETFTEAQQALALDAKNWRAQLVVASHELDLSLYELQPSGTPPLDQELPDDSRDKLLHDIYDHPPELARALAMQLHDQVILQHFQQAVDSAPGNPLPQFALDSARFCLNAQEGSIRALLKLRPADFKSFSSQTDFAHPSSSNAYFQMIDAIVSASQSAAKLSPDDPQLVAGAAIACMLNDMLKASQNGPNPTATLSATSQSAFDDAQPLLDPLTRSPDEEIAAKACEAKSIVVIMQSIELATLRGNEDWRIFNPEVATLAGHAIALNPNRVHALDVLCEEAIADDDLPALRALTEIRRAVIDDGPSLLDCAGAEAKLGHWPESRKFLETALARDPQNADAYIYLMGVEVRQNDAAALNAAAPQGKDILPVCSKQQFEDLMVNITIAGTVPEMKINPHQTLDTFVQKGAISGKKGQQVSEALTKAGY